MSIIQFYWKLYTEYGFEIPMQKKEKESKMTTQRNMTWDTADMGTWKELVW